MKNYQASLDTFLFCFVCDGQLQDQAAQMNALCCEQSNADVRIKLD